MFFDSLRQDTLLSLRATKLPPFLWRVQHPDSQSSFAKNCDLVARLHDQIPSTLYELKASLTRHLKWGHSRAESYFISTFDDYDVALEWARQSRKRYSDEVSSIYRIRTEHLRDAWIFSVEKVLARLKIEGFEDRDVKGEFVILGRIPARAIGLFEVVGEEKEESVDIPESSGRLTPWQRTLQRRTTYYSTMSGTSGSTTEGILCAEDLARLEGGQRRKSAYESVYEWVPEVGDERRKISFDEEEDGEADNASEERRRSSEEQSTEENMPLIPHERDSMKVDSIMEQKADNGPEVTVTWYGEEESPVSPLMMSVEMAALSLEDDVVSWESFEER